MKAAGKREPWGDVLGVEAPAGQPPLKKIKVAPEANTEEADIAARGPTAAVDVLGNEKAEV